MGPLMKIVLDTMTQRGLGVPTKHRNRTTHKSDYMSGKLEKVEILKKINKGSKWGRNILMSLHF